MDIATKQFKRDFIIKTLVNQEQFGQWLKFLFYLNDSLQKEYDTIYQDAFYVKLYETLTTGLKYAQGVHDSLIKGENAEKTLWFNELINGLKAIKESIDDSEFLYIEYRRHNASHIFQTQYEHIQDDYRIKKIRNNRDLVEINNKLKYLLLKHGSDRNTDDYLNKKLQPFLTTIYKRLTELTKT